MTPEAWSKARRVCEVVWDGEGNVSVESLCAGDDALRAMVQELLAADASASVFLESPPTLPTLDGEDESTADAPIGAVFGEYEILEPLGAGGMGEVFLARQRQPRREVALKILPASRGGARGERAFVRESEALGRLSHPNIAQVFEAGVWEDGESGAARPFIAMERVQGAPLTEWAREASPSIEARVRVFIKVCEGIAHAHQRGVIHRDIKPSNILVADVNGEATPKIIDFGIARFAEAEFNDTLSQHGGERLVGTIPYMSPEQVRGDARAIDTRTDVYALGAVLYELLAGRRAFGASGRAFETMRAICDAPAPAMQLQQGGISHDLEAVTLKALEKAPERRYQSAGELAADLKHALAHEPVTARAQSAAYRLRRYVRRNAIAVSGVSAVFVALAVGFGVAAWQAAEARRAAALAENRLRDVREIANGLIFDVHDAIAELPGSTGARALLVEKAIEYLDRIVEDDAAADPAFVVEVARSYIRLGDLQGNHYSQNVGNADGARETYSRAIQLLEQSPGLAERNEEILRLYAGALMARGLVTSSPGKIYGDYQRAWDIQLALVTEHPESEADLLALEDIAWRLGSNYFNIKDVAGGLRIFDLAIGMFEQRRLRGDMSAPLVFAELNLRYFRGFQLVLAERWGEALEPLRGVVAELRALQSSGDGGLAVSTLLMRAISALARAEAFAGSLESALLSAREALDMAVAAVTHDPGDALALRYANIVHEAMASVHARCAARVESEQERIALLERAVELQRQTVAYVAERVDRGWLPTWESHYPAVAQRALEGYEAQLEEARRVTGEVSVE